MSDAWRRVECGDAWRRVECGDGERLAHHRTAFVAAGLICLFLASCAGFPRGTPRWVEDPYHERSRDRIVAAVGIGSDEASAANNARAEVSRVLQAEVNSELVTETSARVESSDGVSRSTVIEDVIERVSIGSRLTLAGSEITDSWRRKDGSVFALAVLDKAKMRAALGRDLADREERIRLEVDAAARAANPLDAARAYLRALPIAEERNELLGPYRAVGGRGSASVDGVSAAAIASQIEERLSEVQIRIDAGELDLAAGTSIGRLPALAAELGEQLTEMGLRVSHAEWAGGDELLLSARIGAERFDRGIPGYTTYRWQASYELVATGQEALLASSLSGDESHMDARAARTLAIRKGQLQLSQALRKNLMDYLQRDAGGR